MIDTRFLNLFLLNLIDEDNAIYTTIASLPIPFTTLTKFRRVLSIVIELDNPIVDTVFTIKHYNTRLIVSTPLIPRNCIRNHCLQLLFALHLLKRTRSLISPSSVFHQVPLHVIITRQSFTGCRDHFYIYFFAIGFNCQNRLHLLEHNSKRILFGTIQ